MAIEIGNKARLVQREIAGVITDTKYSKAEKCLEHFVEYTDEGGEKHGRWFVESQLEEVPTEEVEHAEVQA